MTNLYVCFISTLYITNPLLRPCNNDSDTTKRKVLYLDTKPRLAVLVILDGVQQGLEGLGEGRYHGHWEADHERFFPLPIR